MKHIFSIVLFLCLVQTSYCTKYYVSAGGNDVNSGLTTGLSWASTSKVNSFSFASGDTILFNRGDVFYGSLIPGRSNLLFDAYGSGALPIITGFTTLTSWTNDGAGIWHKNITAASTSLIVVSIDNNLQRLGRFPNWDASNGGYLTYENINSSTPSIIDYQLTNATTWTGAEIAVRKLHWIIDRCRVTNHHNDSILNYTNPVTPNTYYGKVNFGYFFQDDIRTLDQFGEWFLNKGTKDLSVYFGGLNPASYTIKCSTVDTLVNLGGGSSGKTARSNITVQNIAFEGANKTAFFAWVGTNIYIKNCTFNNNSDAIFLWNITNSLTDGNTITNCLNNGIGQYGQVSGPTVIQNNTVRKCGMFAGMGFSGDGMYCGIRQTGDNSTHQYNRIDSIGYNALEFQSSNVLVDRNYVTNFCMTKDDGGGIYTWSQNGGTTYANRIVSNNIVIGAIGAPLGTSGGTLDADCIYLDGGANNVTVINNTLSTAMSAGIFANNIFSVRMTGNTIYNVPKAISMQRFNGSPLLRNVIITSNISYPNTSNIFYWNAELNVPSTTTIQADMRAIGTYDSNYYRNDISAQFDWFYHLTAGVGFSDPPSNNFSQWQTFINQESHSSVLSTAAVNFLYNASNAPATSFFAGSYLDAGGAVYNSSITLQPYTSALLFYNGAVAPNSGSRSYFLKKRH